MCFRSHERMLLNVLSSTLADRPDRRARTKKSLQGVVPHRATWLVEAWKKVRCRAGTVAGLAAGSWIARQNMVEVGKRTEGVQQRGQRGGGRGRRDEESQEESGPVLLIRHWKRHDVLKHVSAGPAIKKSARFAGPAGIQMYGNRVCIKRGHKLSKIWTIAASVVRSKRAKPTRKMIYIMMSVSSINSSSLVAILPAI